MEPEMLANNLFDVFAELRGTDLDDETAESSIVGKHGQNRELLTDHILRLLSEENTAHYVECRVLTL